MSFSRQARWRNEGKFFEAGESPWQSLDFTLLRVENRVGRARPGGACSVDRRRCAAGQELRAGWAGE